MKSATKIIMVIMIIMIITINIIIITEYYFVGSGQTILEG